MSSTCENCKEGLVSQGESIKKVCPVCKGTAKVESSVVEDEE